MKLPLGFRSGAVAAGLKSSGALDLTVIVNEGPTATAAAVFTTNKIVAAPVTWTRQVIKGGVVRAVVLNSGGANACTGPQGFADTHNFTGRLHLWTKNRIHAWEFIKREYGFFDAEVRRLDLFTDSLTIKRLPNHATCRDFG